MSMTDLFVTQEEYDDLVEQLVLKVADDGYKFDTILCLARGGMRVGDIFSRVHDMPLAILATSSYRQAAGKQQGDLDIAQFITKTGGEIAGRMLLVDDMVDSGKTLEQVVHHFKTTVSGHYRNSCGGALVEIPLGLYARLLVRILR